MTARNAHRHRGPELDPTVGVPFSPRSTPRSRAARWLRVLAGIAVAEGFAIGLGQTYGSTRQERAMRLPGDDIVARPQVITNHAITIDAPPGCVWPWLVQMGWHRAGWYTARWVDKLLFPLNWPSANRIVPRLQHLTVGDFIPDGAPETNCGLIVELLEPEQAMALHSTSHLPLSWRDKAALDWSWSFVLIPVDNGSRTRFLFRSRWVTAPWWFTLGGWLVVVPADFLMSHDMLHGVRVRAEALARDGNAGRDAEGVLTGSNGPSRSGRVDLPAAPPPVRH